jgi:hypothetical protein
MTPLIKGLAACLSLGEGDSGTGDVAREGRSLRAASGGEVQRAGDGELTARVGGWGLRQGEDSCSRGRGGLTGCREKSEGFIVAAGEGGELGGEGFDCEMSYQFCVLRANW